MQVKRYEDAGEFVFADFTIRELSPDAFDVGSVAEIIVPVGADRPRRRNQKKHRLYVVLQGDIEFRVEDATIRLSRGDSIHIGVGEEYGFHNGGYEEGRLLLIRMPGPVKPENA
jgi:mannose-6-phosphate isomerase-like protein (cupin superfamily)